MTDKLKTGLIALSPVAVLVDGERHVVSAGQPLPGLHPHDARELLAAGLVEDPTQTRRDDAQKARVEAAGQAIVEDARAAIEQAMASTVVGVGEALPEGAAAGASTASAKGAKGSKG